ncbi:MAG: SLC13 family permease [Candidatus Margulisbacteria bacterium]|nr:SLC13 family permease [Candidatus Margulisiibacteriota bacterium]
MEPKFIAIAVFALAYILFVIFPNRRMPVAVGSVLLLLLTMTLSPLQTFWAVNWNVMGIFFGMQLLANIFIESRVPAFIAEVIVDRAGTVAWATLLICILTGIISAFVDNVTTVLIVAPIALALARKIKINPTSMIIGIAISSNLQGTATLIGDPPSMLLGAFAKMRFVDFFFYHGRPSIFFAVELGAIASFVVLYFIYRHYKERVKLIPVETVTSWVPALTLGALILCLSFASPLNIPAGLFCLAFAAFALVWKRVSTGAKVFGQIKALDWDSIFFLAGIFILVGSLTLTGWIAVLAEALTGIVGNNLFFGYTLLVFFSVFVSAFIDNIPFLAAMLPVAISISARLGVPPQLFLFGLLIGASLGGNITPFGASANFIACGLLKKEGYPVKFMDFVKIGLPFTLAAVFAGYVFIWFVWR